MKNARVALIGEALIVTDAKNPSLIGITGTATDETKNTITIKTKNGDKKIIKDQAVIKTGNIIIDGKQLTGRIEARIKQ
ncbi:ribonuclease P protein subunit [Candidatus Woesearchaeota archaeon]|nr:ribonuclease P protein subunit [Candidatus Woesearchaeota archaeon]